MIEPKKQNLFSRTLAKLQSARWSAREDAKNELWKRNGLENPKLRDNYRIAETEVVTRGGQEIVDYRLYKLIDASRITISVDMRHEIENIEIKEALDESKP